MDSLFEKFGRSAKEAILYGESQAKSNNHTFTGAYLLLGIIHGRGTIAAEILYSLGLDEARVMLLSGNLAHEPPSPGVNQELRDLLQKAVSRATMYGHFFVESEHLLHAIVSSPSSSGAEVIQRAGLSPEVISNHITQIFDRIAEMDGEPVVRALAEEPRTVRGSKSSSVLQTFATDLTKLAGEKKLDPLIGRSPEVERLINVLLRRTKNNPVLLGEPGVGKTAIVEGLATRIVERAVPETLEDHRILQLDLALLVAGTMYRGQFEERIKKFIEAVISAKKIILFVDELHTVVGAGSAEGSLDVSNIMKPALSRGQLRLIGATTYEEYRKYIEKDKALERRFAPVEVKEPTIEETVQILDGIKDRLESHHLVFIPKETIRETVHLASRHIHERYFPDKAIDLLDEAAAAKSSRLTSTGSIVTLKKMISDIEAKKNQAVLKDEHERAFRLRSDLELLKERLNHERSGKNTRPMINPADIAAVVSLWTKIPLNQIIRDENLRLESIETRLRAEVVGQDAAIDEVSRAIRRSKVGIKNPHRPIGSFLFLGPSGVGKSHLVKVLAREIYGDEQALIQIDMSEFIERHTISRLLGAPAGYVGFEEGGKLTEAVRKRPYSIILFDEIEKAHPDVYNILLQIMEEGLLTDAQGRRADFRHTIVIATSNLGTGRLRAHSRVGFMATTEAALEKSESAFETVKAQLLKEVKDYFRPEFIGRLDSIIVFRALTPNDMKQIAELELKGLERRLQESGYPIKIDRGLIPKLVTEGFEPENGARPLRGAILRLVEDPITEQIIAGGIKKGIRSTFAPELATSESRA